MSSSFVAINMPGANASNPPETKRPSSLPTHLPSHSVTSKVSAKAEFTFESIAERSPPMLYPDKILEQLHSLDTEITAITSKKRSFKNLLKGKANELISVAVAAAQGVIASASSIPNSPDVLTNSNSSWFPASLGFVAGLAGSALTRQSSVAESNQLEDLKGQRRKLLAELTALYLEKSEAFITKYVNHTFMHLDLKVTTDAKLIPFIETIKAEEDSLINKEITSMMVDTAKKLHSGLSGYITQLQKELSITEQEAKDILTPLKDTTRLIELKDRVTRETLSAADISLLNSMVAIRDMYQAARDQQSKSLVERAQVRMAHETAITALKAKQIEADAYSEIAFTTLDTQNDNLKEDLKKTNGVVAEQGEQVGRLSTKVTTGFTRVDASITQLREDTDTKIVNFGKMLTTLSQRIAELNETIITQHNQIEAQAEKIASQGQQITDLITSNKKRKAEIGGVLVKVDTISNEVKRLQSRTELVVRIPTSTPSSQIPITISRSSIAPVSPSVTGPVPIIGNPHIKSVMNVNGALHVQPRTS